MSDDQLSRKAINDARALLDALLASDCHDIHVRSGDTEIFIAREGGRSNPMLSAPVASSAATSAYERTVTAPHVATVVSIAAGGTRLSAGDRLAVLDLLGEEVQVLAATAGVVGRHLADAGDLVEHDMPLAVLLPS